MPTNNVKENARKLIDRLPDDSTWDDIMYEMYVRQKIERGLQDAAEGKTTDHKGVKKQYSMRNGISLEERDSHGKSFKFAIQ